MQAFINKFIRCFLKKTKRTCEHCAVYDAKNKNCQIFNCCYFPTDFCMRWIKRD